MFPAVRASSRALLGPATLCAFAWNMRSWPHQPGLPRINSFLPRDWVVFFFFFLFLATPWDIKLASCFGPLLPSSLLLNQMFSILGFCLFIFVLLFV